MKNMARHIVTGTLTLLVLWAASCSHDTGSSAHPIKNRFSASVSDYPQEARSPVKAMKLVKRMKTT